MTGVFERGEELPTAVPVNEVDSTQALTGAAETLELIAQIRQLAAHDPAGVQQVVAEVLAALNRATGGALGEGLAVDMPLAVGDDPSSGLPGPSAPVAVE